MGKWGSSEGGGEEEGRRGEGRKRGGEEEGRGGGGEERGGKGRKRGGEGRGGEGRKRGGDTVTADLRSMCISPVETIVTLSNQVLSHWYLITATAYIKLAWRV